MINFTKAIKVSGFSLKSTQPMYEHQSWTGKVLQRGTGIQYYEAEFTLTYNITDRPEVDQFLALHSLGKPFQMDLGHLSKYTGTQTAAVTSTAAKAAGSASINTSNQSLRVGDRIQFTNHTKIYSIIDRTNTTVTIFPALRQSVATGEIIKYSNITMTGILKAENTYVCPVTNVTTQKLTVWENL